jgi:hypothetical protein
MQKLKLILRINFHIIILIVYYICHWASNVLDHASTGLDQVLEWNTQGTNELIGE